MLACPLLLSTELGSVPRTIQDEQVRGLRTRKPGGQIDVDQKSPSGVFVP